MEGFMRHSSVLLTAGALSLSLAALALAGCGREADRASRADISSADRPSAAGARVSDAASSATRASYEPRASRRQDDGPRFGDGKPQWASSRQRSGDENAERQFERNGKDFGAASEQAYIARAHAFVSDPPKGVLTLTRPNGDVLYYDAKANVFAVADRQGAPRTMFKPRDGMSYWTQQKDRVGQQDRGDSGSDRGGRRRRSASDEDASG
jgi:hypothetical protein